MINGLPPFYDTNRKLMYHRILTAPVQKTHHMSPEVGLLTIVVWWYEWFYEMIG